MTRRHRKLRMSPIFEFTLQRAKYCSSKETRIKLKPILFAIFQILMPRSSFSLKTRNYSSGGTPLSIFFFFFATWLCRKYFSDYFRQEIDTHTHTHTNTLAFFFLVDTLFINPRNTCLTPKFSISFFFLFFSFLWPTSKTRPARTNNSSPYPLTTLMCR